MAFDVPSLDARYVDLLNALWEEFEDLLDAYSGRRAARPDSVDLLRGKLDVLRHRLVSSLERSRCGAMNGQPSLAHDESSVRLLRELIGLLDSQRFDDDFDFDLGCGTTLVIAQNRIFDEAERLARRADRADRA
jgi:hypothetical protein